MNDTANSDRVRFLERLLRFLHLRAQPVSEDDVSEILAEAKKSGAINPTEHELIESIFEFTDTTVKEIMVPRSDVVAVELSTPKERLVRMVLDEGYSRIPVYRETLDSIVGLLYTKDLLSMFEHRDVIILQDILRPAYLVPESKKISALMRELQSRKQHMAVVIGEFGGVEGIVTMEDILEEIVGEIRDEYDEDHREVETSVDGSVFVSGGISIADFNRRFRAAVPEGTDYETISGFLHKLTGKIPDLHEEIRYGGQVFTVVRKNERRIQQLRVRSAGSMARS